MQCTKYCHAMHFHEAEYYMQTYHLTFPWSLQTYHLWNSTRSNLFLRLFQHLCAAYLFSRNTGSALIGSGVSQCLFLWGTSFRTLSSSIAYNQYLTCHPFQGWSLYRFQQWTWPHHIHSWKQYSPAQSFTMNQLRSEGPISLRNFHWNNEIIFGRCWKNLKLGTNKLKLEFKHLPKNIFSMQQHPPRKWPVKSTPSWRKMKFNCTYFRHTNNTYIRGNEYIHVRGVTLSSDTQIILMWNFHQLLVKLWFWAIHDEKCRFFV